MKQIEINKYQPYISRDERNKFMAITLKKYFNKSVLNVGGGGKKHLLKYLDKDVDYTEIDIDGNPDFKLNLEIDMPLPFSNKSFDTVVATDILEHIDNLHEVIDEIVRVSSEYIIISLPNPWAGMKHSLITGTWNLGKYYGLPIEKPLDRHKWIFSYTEAEKFLTLYAKKNNLHIVELFPINYKTDSFLKNAIRSFVEVFYGKEGRKNLFATTIWCVYKKI